MNMFKPTKAKTIEEYMGSLPPEQRDVIVFMHDFIRKTVPSLRPHLAASMLGYGSFPYLNSKKEEIGWPVIGLVGRKNYVSLYVCAVADGKYVAEAHAKQLGKVKVGKSCITFKKVEDLDLATLKKVLKMAEKQPGLVSAAMKKGKAGAKKT